MSSAACVLDEVRRVIHERTGREPEVRTDSRLFETGLDSLGMAILVARLEDAIGVDPFAALGDDPFPDTVAELIALCDRALA